MTKRALRQSIAALFAEQISGQQEHQKKEVIFQSKVPPPLIFWSAADTFSSVNCYQKTFRKVGNKAIYLEACHTVVHVEGGVLKIHIQGLFSHHQPLFIVFSVLHTWKSEPMNPLFLCSQMNVLVGLLWYMSSHCPLGYFYKYLGKTKMYRCR